MKRRATVKADQRKGPFGEKRDLYKQVCFTSAFINNIL